MGKTKARVIYWFRTDLRLHDSPALKAALDLNPEFLWPIFTWDPHYVYRARGGLNRWQFLLDCQNDLSQAITKLNPKSKLFVLREAPQTLFPKLFKAWKVTHLVFEKDTDEYGRSRDSVVEEAARQNGVKVVIRYGRTLWDSDELVVKNGGKPTMSITQLQHAAQKIGPVPKPIPAPSRLPDPGPVPVHFDHDDPERLPDVNAKWRDSDETAYLSIAGPNGDFAIETLAELGFQEATTPHRGGESLALVQLENIMKDQHYVATFRKPQTSPAAFSPQSTCLLSPHFHFGSLSVRLFYWRVQDAVTAYSKTKKDASTPPESLTGQVLFRDMYFAAQAGQPFFNQTAHNAHVRFIPWHLPSRLDPASGRATFEYDVDSAQADTWFRRWRAGQTGFPWIDALMRQLRVEGWIHHLGRHSVACFLTRGGCYVDWERGAEVFEELLIDHEVACNAGNWQWLACAAFFSQFYRCYSPIAFGKKWDPEGEFVRRWVPELKAMDKKFIYEPWKAPIQDQKLAGVKITGDGAGWAEGDQAKPEPGTYPKPMFDFNERRAVCIEAIKKAYEIGLYGNDERVLNGTWKDLFTESGGGTEMLGSTIDEDGDHADNSGPAVKGGPTTPKKSQSGKSSLPVNPRRRTAGQQQGQTTLDGFAKKQKIS